ncbi:FAD-dependent oxidoreductase [Sanguibacter sp. HDW7]|uniref:FAD-dependent oxidoreductase n=1 Tax=Sanguibacter sp. HDW7 TaxID=2714931 RepID=UPI00140CC3DE|nr:FAD-dependent oxidoreductase [Sanguibacter sp. HDW7]QIK83039.1 FAD-dependent oxidoreductase [Sanguibacter sp. HDW7]
MTENRRPRTVIVGGVAGGMSAATRLRRLDEQREIVVLERGEHVSFANCGLPYHVGGVIEERSALLLQTPESLRARFDLDVRTGHEVVSIDRAARTVSVRTALGTEDIAYDELVLATGAAPVRPGLPGAERAHVLRDVADVDRIVAALAAGDAPRTAAIVGAGFIGLELAENLEHRGLDVTLVELADQVLPPLDAEMARLVQDRLEAHGVTVRTGSAATAVEGDDLVLADGSRIPAALLVMAVGVTPESCLAREAGLETGARGAVLVDDAQRTSDPHVYAVGDVALKRDAIDDADTFVPLAQTANRHGRLVADAIVGREVTALPVLGTAIVGVFGLTAASTGWSEKRARAAGRDVRVVHTHPADHAGYYPGASPMALKLVVDPATDAILGAQGVGEAGVDKRIDVIATAMRGSLTASDLADLELAYAPQFGSAKDPVNMLGMVAENLATGTTRSLQWHELDDALAGGAVLVDVRTAEEHAAGSIPGALNIPVDDLRARHGELAGRAIVVHCAVGQRGHTAARLLTQLGHPAVNLDGGYRTWSTASRTVAAAV